MAFLDDLFATGAGIGQIEISPALRIVPVGPTADPTGYGGVVFTSAHAVPRVRALPGLMAWCVGSATADAASAAGFTAISANGAAGDLADAIVEASPTTPLLYARGVHTRGRLAERLREAGIPVETVVVYDQRPERLTPGAKAMLQGTEPSILPLFSPRTAEIVRNAVDEPGEGLSVVALSPAVAAAWGVPVASIAESPDNASMLRAVVEALTAARSG